MNSFGFNSYKSIGSVVLEQWLRLLALCFLTLKPNSICPITLHHLANNILLSFQFDALYLSMRLSFYLMVIYGFEVFWLWPTKVNSFFLVGAFFGCFCEVFSCEFFQLGLFIWYVYAGLLQSCALCCDFVVAFSFCTCNIQNFKVLLCGYLNFDLCMMYL